MSNADNQRYLTFSLGNEHYAIPLLSVKEVIANIETTPVPYTPSYFKGIMNLRGHVISIIDLRMKFKMAKAELKPETSIIILDLNPFFIGVIVDSIESVLSFSLDEIGPAPDIESTIKTDFIKGVARKDKRLILILDVAATLNVEDLKAIKKQVSKSA